MKSIIKTGIKVFVMGLLIAGAGGVKAQIKVEQDKKVGIGLGPNESVHSSAILEVREKAYGSMVIGGLLIPQVTQIEMSQIQSPKPGLIVYNIDEMGLCYYGSTGWVCLTGSTGGDQTISRYGTNGEHLQLTNGGQITNSLVPENGTTGQVLTKTSGGYEWQNGGGGGGGVTGVTATAPISSTGGATPNISISQSSTSTDGYLSSTDWNTFNSKVGGSGVANKVAFFNSSNNLNSDNLLHWDNTNKRLGIGTTTPPYDLSVVGRMDLRLTAAKNNIAIGTEAMLNIGTDTNNIAIGSRALKSITTGGNITAIGTNAARNLTTARNSTIIGRNALSAVTTGGGGGVYVGASAGGTLTTGGNDAVIVGFGAGLYSTTGLVRSVIVGRNASANTTTGGNESVIIGRDAAANGNGSNNTIIGHQTFINAQNFSNNNTIIGYQANAASTLQRTNNTVVGHQAGYSAGGSYNVFLGNASGFSEANSNRLYIENSNSSTPLIGGHFDNDKVGINRNINNINTTLHVGGNVTIDNISGTATKLTGFDATNKVVEMQIGAGIDLSGGTISSTITQADGSETKVNAGTNVTVTGTGTTADPYVVNSTGGATNLSYSTKSGTDVYLESSTGADVILRDGIGTTVNRVASNVVKIDVNSAIGQVYNGVRDDLGDAYIQNYSTSGSQMGDGVLVQQGDGTVITHTASTNGGSIKVDATSATFGQLERLYTDYDNNSITGSEFKIDFDAVHDNKMTANSSTDRIIRQAGCGDWRITYSLTYQITDNSNYVGGFDFYIKYNGTRHYNLKHTEIKTRNHENSADNLVTVSKDFIIHWEDFYGGSYIELFAQRNSGTFTSAKFIHVVFNVQQITNICYP